MARKQNQQKHAVTWAQTVRDVLIRSMDKGQGPLYLFGLLVIVIILKMPGEDVSMIANRLVEATVALHTVGWIASVVILICWVVHSRHIRRVAYREQERMGKEKARLQEKLLGSGTVKSSKDQ